MPFQNYFLFFYDSSGGYIMTHIECKWDHALNIVIRYSGEILFPFIVLLFKQYCHVYGSEQYLMFKVLSSL